MELPTPSHALAVVLELAIFGTFAAEQSLPGMVLCLCYGWFSATRALFDPPAGP